jgi:tripartite-type tricarboxylate transporter receptor subunit TctC
MKRRWIEVALAASIALASSGALAQGFPARPVTIIVPFAAGGPAEAIARVVAVPMGQQLGQPVVVELRPGAGGNVGAEYVAKQARPDGYTVLFGSTSLASSVSLLKLAFDPRRDLAPVAGVGLSPNLIIVGPGFPYRTLNDVIKAAHERPSALTFGSSGPGTGSHLAGELFKARAGVELLHIPYRGSGAVLADLVAGRVDLLFELQSSAVARVKAGQVRALATTTLRRIAALPDVPTVAELGFPGFETGAWTGFFVPAATPRDVIARLEAATIGALRSDLAKQRFEEMSVLPIPESAAAFGRYFDADVEAWAKLVRDGRLRIDQ